MTSFECCKKCGRALGNDAIPSAIVKALYIPREDLEKWVEEVVKTPCAPDDEFCGTPGYHAGFESALQYLKEFINEQ